MCDEIQRGRAEQNTRVPHDKRIEFRIGIHVGDIIIADDDIFGDGVNIAVRLEGIAEPGGICISDDAHRQVRGKVESTFEDTGSQNLKNIAEPMRVWCIRKKSVSASGMPAFPLSTYAALPVPEGPSIAVLPFQNMSGDPDEDYFADGMVDEITEQIIGILKEHEAGISVADLCRKHGVSDASIYKWKAKFGGMDVSEAKRLRTLEDENTKLKRLLADAMLDNAALKDLLGKKW